MEYDTHKMDKRNQLSDDSFKMLLDGGVQDAYKRPWHRIERGLRLNRLRRYIEQIAPTYSMTDKEKKGLFDFFQNALDAKRLNTLKVVQYEHLTTQEITSIKGFDIKRTDGILKWGLTTRPVKTESAKAAKPASTRKKKVDKSI
jgi:hypothetical protein